MPLSRGAQGLAIAPHALDQTRRGAAAIGVAAPRCVGDADSIPSFADLERLAAVGQGAQRRLDLFYHRGRQRGVVQLARELLAVVRGPPEEVRQRLRLILAVEVVEVL